MFLFYRREDFQQKPRVKKQGRVQQNMISSANRSSGFRKYITRVSVYDCVYTHTLEPLKKLF